MKTFVKGIIILKILKEIVIDDSKNKERIVSFLIVNLLEPILLQNSIKSIFYILSYYNSDTLYIVVEKYFNSVYLEYLKNV